HHATATAERSHHVNQWIMHHVTDSGFWHTPLWKWHLPSWISNNALMLMICGLLLTFVFGVLCHYKKGRAPKGWTNALEALVLFIRDDISIANLGEKDGRKMAPLFLTFFFFIVTCNLMGLCPMFSTA